MTLMDLIQAALREDMPKGDLTTDSLALVPRFGQAKLIAKEDLVLSGTLPFEQTILSLDPTARVQWHFKEGDLILNRQTICHITGDLIQILKAERVALNFIGHLSGIATLTRRFVDAAATTGSARIWDTRKTTPGLRSLEKAAVRAGGGANHRGNLSDWILLKDNHLALMGIAGAVAAARHRWPARTVHVECDRLDQLVEAIEAGADALLLDNMTPDQVVACVRAADDHSTAAGRRRPLLEVSGGLTLETVASYAGLGIDLISVGGLTNSAAVLDIGLDIV